MAGSRSVIDIDAALSALTLDEKCRLLAGRTTWRTWAFPDAGVPAIKMSDGPNGVRGEGHGGAGTPGVVVPAGITLGASWDPDLVEEIGALLGTESRRKGAHVLLGPTVNLHRTPVGGRTFECYSEDPELSGALGAAFVRGVQSRDVGVTVKHFACNDTEIDRLHVDVRVDERPLRELYLRPFERVVREAHPWGVMSAYNKVDGVHCSENRRLLHDILREEWGFDGVVVSDWFGAHHTVPSAHAGLGLEMPAPARVYGEHLHAAVERGDVDPARVDELVRDLLLLAGRVRADERDADHVEESVDDPDERALTRRAAIAGTVLLANRPVDGAPVLPLDQPRHVAVIGPNAAVDRSMGGGSASLVPFGHRTLLDALTDRIGPESATGATITYEPGVRIDRLTPVPARRQLRQPDGAAGLRVTYVDSDDWDAPANLVQSSPNSLLRFFGSTPDGIDPRRFSTRIEGSFVPDEDGPHEFGVVSTGPVRVIAGATVVADDPEMALPRSEEFFGYGSIEVTTTIECTAGEPVPLDIRWSTSTGNAFAAFRLGVRPPMPPDLMERAARAAAAADVAVVVVGTNDEWETEGFDRTTMDLPGRQDDLVRAVLAANERTVVVVNAGSPVTMDWASDDETSPAPAVLTSFFAGQEQAEGLVDVLLGDADPGGRLPLTYPRRLADHPAFLHHRPDRDGDGTSVQRYGEGLFVGYRAYDATALRPRFAFGHGLSYGPATWGTPTASTTTIAADHGTADDAADDGAIEVTVPVTATGPRPATVVVGGYVAPVDPGCVRPPKELRAWRKAVVAPGETVDVTLTFGRDAFQRWDPAAGGWLIEPGDYDIVLAASAGDEQGRVRVTVR